MLVLAGRLAAWKVIPPGAAAQREFLSEVGTHVPSLPETAAHQSVTSPIPKLSSGPHELLVFIVFVLLV